MDKCCVAQNECHIAGKGNKRVNQVGKHTHFDLSVLVEHVIIIAQKKRAVKALILIVIQLFWQHQTGHVRRNNDSLDFTVLNTFGDIECGLCVHESN